MEHNDDGIIYALNPDDLTNQDHLLDEIQDFTCMTPWEQLSHEIETQLRKWIKRKQDEVALHQKKYKNANIPDFVWTENVLDGERKYRLEYHYIGSHGFDHSLIGLDGPTLCRYLGVYECVVLKPEKEYMILARNREEATLYISALCIASSSCHADIAVFVSLGRASGWNWIGKRVNGEEGMVTYFRSDALEDQPEHLSTLSGFMDLFAMERGVSDEDKLKDLALVVKSTFNVPKVESRAKSPMDLVPPEDILMHHRHHPSSFSRSSSSNTKDHESETIKYFSLPESHPQLNIFVSAVWPCTALSKMSADKMSWSFLPLRAPRWVCLVKFYDELSTRLKYTQELLTLIRCLQSTREISTQSSSPSAETSLQDYARMDSLRRISKKNRISRQHASADQTATASDELAPAANGAGVRGFFKQFISSVSLSQTMSRKNRNDDEGEYDELDNEQEEEENDLVESMAHRILAASLHHYQPNSLHGHSMDDSGNECPWVQTLIRSLLKLLDSDHHFPTGRWVYIMARVWRFCCDTIHDHWKEKSPIFGISSLEYDQGSANRPHEQNADSNSAQNVDAPDLHSSLITQKLQFIQACIQRIAKITNDTAIGDRSASQKDAWDAEWNDSEDELKDTKDGVQIQPEGRRHVLPNMFLKQTHEPMYEPHLQLMPLVTRDMLSEQECALLGITHHLNRAETQSGSLQSDMSSFKAANPGSILYDFVAWFSPTDIEPNGELSARMQDPNNIWHRLWNEAALIPADKQPPLFDPEAEGKKALEFLEKLTCKQLVFELLLAHCRNLVHRFNLARADIRRWISSSGKETMLERSEVIAQSDSSYGRKKRIDDRVMTNFLDRSMNRLQMILDSTFLDLHSSTDENLNRLVESCNHVETILRRMFCIRALFQNTSEISQAVDAIVSESEIDVKDPVSRYDLVLTLHLDDNDNDTGMKAPMMREYVLVDQIDVSSTSMPPPNPNRMYIRHSAEEFRVGFRTHAMF